MCVRLISSTLAGKEPGVFDIVIINDDLERAYEELKDVLTEVSYRTENRTNINVSFSKTPGRDRTQEVYDKTFC